MLENASPKSAKETERDHRSSLRRTTNKVFGFIKSSAVPVSSTAAKGTGRDEARRIAVNCQAAGAAATPLELGFMVRRVLR